jgi:hypothetical protein
MGIYIVTETKSKLTFYTCDNAAFFMNGDLCYQIVYVDQGKNGHRFASMKKVISCIQSGQIQTIEDLAGYMKKDVTYQYTQRRPWMESVARS